MTDPRPPSLDAAVEAMCRSEHPLWGQYRPEARAEVAQKMSRALEVALPHLQASPEGVASEPRPSRAKGSEPATDVPSGGAQEPSEEALIAAVVALAEAQGLAEGVVSSTQAHAALRAAYAVDRPREPSPELREKVAQAILDAAWESTGEGSGPAIRIDRAHYLTLADAALAVLREEQGR